MAERFVRSHLKYPDDAEFVMALERDCGEMYVEGKHFWLVKGKVKAANAFGARLTTRYGIALRKSAPSTWRPALIKLDGEIVYVDETLFPVGTPLPQ